MDATNVQLPTIALALEALDLEVVPAASPTHTEFLKRTFSGVQFWDTHRPLANASGRILLVPGSIDEPTLITLRDALRNGASAIVMSEEYLPDAELWPEIVQASLLLHQTMDWADTALMLRAMCATNFAHETAGFPRGDLFSLAQSLAALAGGAISIVDMSGRVVGYSTLPDQPIDEVRRSTTLALQEAESPRVDRDHLALSRSAKALWFPAGEAGTFSRAALSVRAQNQQIGSVWLIVPDETRRAEACALLDSVAGLVAHHLVEARDAMSAEAQRSSDLLRTLLENESFRGRAAAEIGLRESQAYRAVAFATNGGSHTNPVLPSRRHLHHVWLTARSFFSWTHAAILGDYILCLFPDQSDDLTNSFVSRVLDSSRTPFVAGIGPRGESASAVALSMRESIAIARLLTEPSLVRSASATMPDVQELLGLSRLLQSFNDTGTLDGDAVSRVRAYDARKGTELALTLAVYLEHFGSVVHTAEILHVHPNTVRYRLEQMQNDLSIDLSSHHVRLWISLRFLHERLNP
ncbi:MAG: PucR family transcriptional regulator [Canibacter sp.]